MDSTTEITEIEDTQTEKMDVTEEEYVKIPKKEYESFKVRVSAIETRISQEFNSIKLDSIKAESEATQHSDVDDSLALLNGPEKVINKFNKMLEETESISNQNSVDDQIAKQMSKELKIRRSVESKIIRSPSARKIGSIRRRSKEGVRLSRNQSWHLGSGTAGLLNESKSTSFYPKANLRRGRPNTIQTGLRPIVAPPIAHVTPITEHSINDEGESWTSGEEFFKDTSNDNYLDLTADTGKTEEKCFNESVFKTPEAGMKSLSLRSAHKMEAKTPMLPPALPPRRTPSTANKKSQYKVFSNVQPKIIDIAGIDKNCLTPLQDNIHGRASIAKIRIQNAGAVRQKAKLFDGMCEKNKEPNKIFISRIDVQISKSNRTPTITETPREKHPIIVNKPLENIRNSEITPQKSPHRKVPSSVKSNGSPRSPRSPRNRGGVNRRQKLRSTNSPNPLKTFAEKSNRSENRENKFKSRMNLLDNGLLDEMCSPSKIQNHQLLKNNFPPIRKPLAMTQSSPRRILKTPVKSPANKRTPLKAAQGYSHLNHIRHSPRLSTVNRKSLKSTY